MDIIDYQIDNILFSCIIGSNIYCREKRKTKRYTANYVLLSLMQQEILKTYITLSPFLMTVWITAD